MQSIDPNKVITPEKRAQNREKQLLTFVVKATARDQEKNILISKLQRKMSEATENLGALQAEVTLKDKILDAKEDELLTIKSENESLKQQIQHLLMSNKRTDLDNKTPLKPSNNNNNNFGLKKNNDNNDVVKFNNFKSPNLKSVKNLVLKKNDNDVKIKDDKSPGLPTTLTPEFSRKRSLKKPNTPKDNMTNLIYNLRKKSKK